MTLLQTLTDGQDTKYLLYFGLIFLVMYYFMLRPLLKKQKNERKLREELKKGDDIITIGGIHGRIVEMKGSSVTIESYGVKLKVEKSAIAMNVVSEKLS